MPKEEEPEEDEDSEEKSELEEELEEEPEVDTQKLQSLLQTQVRQGSPSLEQVEVASGPAFSLEQGVGLEGSTSGKEDDTKYETIKDPSQDYEDPSKRKSQMSGGEPTPISASSHIDMASMGRGPERMGQEFHMTQPSELSNRPESVRDYETVTASKSDDFKGEKTAFQQDMDRRYDPKK